MEIVPFIIFTAVISALGINGAPTGELNEDMILEKFVKIKDNCLGYLDSYKNQNNKNTTQILCVMVMSAFEVNNKNEFPNERIKPILNMKKKDIAVYYGKEKIHGEIQAIRLDDDIQQLIQRFNKKSKTAGEGLPYVFVYSYFIPCASVSNVRYSCAEELAKHARLNYNSNFNMLVAYSAIFDYTDSDLANDYLHQRGMFALVNLQTETVQMGTDDQTFFEPQITVFQDRLHDCILQNTASSKSGDDSTIVRDKINCFVQKCTSESKERGPLTHLDMWIVHECFRKEHRWTKRCNGPKQEQFEVVKCLLNVMEDNYKDPKTLLVLGIPGQDTAKPYWTQSEDVNTEWSLVYKDYQPPVNIGTLPSKQYMPGANSQRMTNQILRAQRRNQNDHEARVRTRKPQNK